MEWITALRGSVVGLDTAPLIYLIEESPLYLAALRAFFAAANQGEFKVVTSVLTLTEVVVHPLRRDNSRLAGVNHGWRVCRNRKCFFSAVSRCRRRLGYEPAKVGARVPDSALE